MTSQKTMNKTSLNPKTLFLIDGFGAILSAFLLGVVLVKFENVFGIPKSTLHFLAVLPCVFAAYDFYCYLRINENLDYFLKGIASANLLYACISLGLAFHHQQKLTTLGWTYIILEIAIILILVNIELKKAAELNSSK